MRTIARMTSAQRAEDRSDRSPVATEHTRVRHLALSIARTTDTSMCDRRIARPTACTISALCEWQHRRPNLVRYQARESEAIDQPVLLCCDQNFSVATELTSNQKKKNLKI